MSAEFADKFIAGFIAEIKSAPKADFSGLCADMHKAADRIELRRSRERGHKMLVDHGLVAPHKRWINPEIAERREKFRREKELQAKLGL